MKKFLFVVFISAAVNVYSIEFSGQIYGGFNLFSATTKENEDAMMGGINEAKGQIEAWGERGKFGALLRLGYEFEKNFFGDFDIYWRQSEIFAFYLTYYTTDSNGGHFPLDNIVGRNFYGFTGKVLGLDGCANSKAFYGGFFRGAFVTINPIDALEINFGLNMFTRDTAAFIIKSMTLQVMYTFGSIGTLGLTYEGDYMTRESLDDNPAFSFYYNHSGFNNIDIDAGIRYQIPDTRDTGGTKITRHHPINLGIGAVFNFDNINLKTRLSTGFLGSDKVQTALPPTTENKMPFDIGIDIVPSYSFTSAVTGYLNTGICFYIPDEGDNDILWRINPYVVIGNENAAAFYAGLDFYNTAIGHKSLYFDIAIGLSFTF